jgi:hypothetical protein
MKDPFTGRNRTPSISTVDGTPHSNVGARDAYDARMRSQQLHDQMERNKRFREQGIRRQRSVPVGKGLAILALFIVLMAVVFWVIAHKTAIR